MTKVYLFFIFMFSIIIVQAQSVSSDIISTSGNVHSAQDYVLEWTIGEPVTETVTLDENTITQGFHQPNLYKITEITEVENFEGYQVSVYPNPAIDHFYIEFSDPSMVNDIKLLLFNNSGKQILEAKVTPYTNQFKINLPGLPSETLHMVLMDHSNGIVKRFKIVKINQ